MPPLFVHGLRHAMPMEKIYIISLVLLCAVCYCTGTGYQCPPHLAGWVGESLDNQPSSKSGNSEAMTVLLVFDCKCGWRHMCATMWPLWHKLPHKPFKALPPTTLHDTLTTRVVSILCIVWRTHSFGQQYTREAALCTFLSIGPACLSIGAGNAALAACGPAVFDIGTIHF